MTDSHLRVDAYDIARGIGIILVIIGHNVSSTRNIKSVIYSFHMPLFLFISGLVFRKKEFSSFVDLIRNEKKLLSSYCFYSLFFILFDIIVRIIILHQGISLIFWDFYETFIFLVLMYYGFCLH